MDVTYFADDGGYEGLLVGHGQEDLRDDCR